MATPGRKPKRKLAGTTPPKRKAKGGKNSEADCLICEKPILDVSENCVGEDAVFCEGSCQGWIHRTCAGVTRPAFEKLEEPGTHYLCSYCTLVSQNKEIKNLANIIQNLNTSIVSLTETITSLQSCVTKQCPTSDQPVNDETNVNGSTQKTALQDTPQQDRKFNVVIYGIQECSKGTPKHERLNHDLDKVTSTITEGDNSISPLSIRDMFRLGKYREQSKIPRPILVKLNRTMDVSVLLTKARSLPKHIRLKPDMSPAERLVESLLLKERWSLIQSGIDRKEIKICSNKIFVKQKLHGQVINSTYTPTQSQSHDTEMDSSKD